MSCRSDTVFSYTQVPFFAGGTAIIRTPDRPGVDPQCDQCEGGGFAYAIAFQVSHADSNGYTVSVGAPWNVYLFSSSQYVGIYCPAHLQNAASCYAGGQLQNPQGFVVATSDPNAPARNITIQYNNPLGCQH
jgi:hypothetical protein